MSKIKQSKLRLLQGAGVILAFSGGITEANAQAETQVGSTITETGADGVIASDQSTTNNVTATASGTNSVTTVGAVTNGGITGGGVTGTVALGNLDTLTFSDTGSAINGTSDAMVALQDSTGTSDTNILIKADTLNTTTGLDAEDVTSSSLSVVGATDTSSATANSATQTMTLSATELTLGTSSGTADSVGALDLDANGKAVAASLQNNSYADVEANTTGSTVQLTAGDTTDSALSVNIGVQSATASGSTATNGVTVSGTSLGIGVVIASQQLNDDASSVSANTAGSSTLSASSLDGSSATMSTNRLLSQAIGGQTTNTLTATGNNVSLTAADTTSAAVLGAGAGTVSGAFATLNDQEINGAVSSITTTETDTSAMKIGIGDDATNSTINNDSNTVSAKAQGALTTNQTTLTVAATLDKTGTDTESGVANGATVANVQNIGADADITATVKTDGASKDMILTDVDGALTGSTLSTSSNKITATAESANASNGLIVSATDIAVAAEGTATPYVGATSATAGTANTAFSVANAQVSLANDVTATAGDNATVYTVVDGTADGAIVNSTLNSNSNAISSLATSNRAANSLTLTGTTVAADAGVLNVQSSTSEVNAEVGSTGDAGVYVEANEDVIGSAVALNGNIVQGGAASNSASNQLTISATTLDSGTVSSGVATATNATARGTADYAVANLQTVIGATTSDVDSVISFDQTTGEELSDSRLSIANNIQFSEALGSSASNGITIAATTLETGVAIASQQVSQSTGTVTANNAGSVTMSVAELDGSTASVTGNRLQSQANGLQTANTLSVTGTNATLSPIDTTAGTVVTAGSAGTATANFALLNDQDVGADVSATTTSQTGDAAMQIAVDGAVFESTIANDANIVSARAQGAASTNLSTLTVAGSLASSGTTAGGIANGATVANVQTVGNAADVTATVTTADGTSNTIMTDLGSSLTNTAVTASSNRITATAEGANSTNSLSISATDIAVAAQSTGVPVVEADFNDEKTVNTAFSVLNTQVGGTADVTATMGDTATVYSVVDGEIENSSITSNANTISGFATSNKAANSLSLAGTNVAGDAGLLNAQTSNADVAVTIGDSEQAGVFVESNNAITDSAISVNSNIVQGSAVNNSVNNLMTVAATALDGGGTAAKAVATGTPTIWDGSDVDVAASAKAQADYSLANLQRVESSASTVSDIAATFGIDQASGEVLQDSRLSVSSNTQFGEALANTATNRLTLSATDAGAGIVPTAALSSTQDATFSKQDSNSTANNDVSSTSDMNVYVSAASMGSSIAANGNANTALAVMNNAGNTLSVTGTNLGGTNGLATTDAGYSATADVALNSYQTATGNLASSASTNLYNFDEAQPASAGTLDSSVSFASNATTSEASANRVANAVTISGTADVGATAALNNTQVSDTVVGASATTTLEYTMTAGSPLFELDSTDVYAADGSSIVVDGNSTTAMARGNTANNSLNYAAGASYSGVTTTPIVAASGTELSAGAALLNNQSNQGAVSATALTATYSIALDDGTATTDGVTFGAALNSSVSLVNNSTAAAAYGNSAVNTLAMGTFGAGVPSSGLTSLQANSGAVSATATSVGYNLTLTGASSGTAVRNAGNVVTAQAVGNSSVSTITGGN